MNSVTSRVWVVFCLFSFPGARALGEPHLFPEFRFAPPPTAFKLPDPPKHRILEMGLRGFRYECPSDDGGGQRLNIDGGGLSGDFLRYGCNAARHPENARPSTTTYCGFQVRDQTLQQVRFLHTSQNSAFQCSYTPQEYDVMFNYGGPDGRFYCRRTNQLQQALAVTPNALLAYQGDNQGHNLAAALQTNGFQSVFQCNRDASTGKTRYFGAMGIEGENGKFRCSVMDGDAAAQCEATAGHCSLACGYRSSGDWSVVVGADGTPFLNCSGNGGAVNQVGMNFLVPVSALESSRCLLGLQYQRGGGFGAAASITGPRGRAFVGYQHPGAPNVAPLFPTDRGWTPEALFSPGPPSGSRNWLNIGVEVKY